MMAGMMTVSQKNTTVLVTKTIIMEMTSLNRVRTQGVMV